MWYLRLNFKMNKFKLQLNQSYQRLQIFQTKTMCAKHSILDV